MKSNYLLAVLFVLGVVPAAGAFAEERASEQTQQGSAQGRNSQGSNLQAPLPKPASDTLMPPPLADSGYVNEMMRKQKEIEMLRKEQEISNLRKQIGEGGSDLAAPKVISIYQDKTGDYLARVKIGALEKTVRAGDQLGRDRLVKEITADTVVMKSSKDKNVVSLEFAAPDATADQGLQIQPMGIR